jgi:hypothetical protein
MNDLGLRLVRTSALAALVIPALAGCAGADGKEPADEQVAKGSEAVTELVLHVQPSAKRMKVYRVVSESVAAANPHLVKRLPGSEPLAMIDANLCQDGTAGSSDPTLCGLTAGTQTVELVTDDASINTNSGCPSGYQTNSFCGDVTLNSFWNAPLNNTYAQVTAVFDGTGATVTGHEGWNVDSPGATGLSNSLGLWQHQSPSIDTSHFSNGSTGVMLPGVANGGKRTWVFKNPDNADVYYRIKVWASQSYSQYSLGTAFHSFVDACTVGSGESKVTLTNTGTGLPLNQPAVTNQRASFSLPFAFTFYGQRLAAGTSFTVSKWGNIGLGGTNASTSDTNLALPNTGAPRPGVFVFWDHLRWATSGSRGLCAKLTGAAPNRQLAVTWKRVGFNGNDASFMTFSTVFNESTEEIWFQYPTMAGSSTFGGATVGAQNDTGTAAATGSTATQGTFPSGTYKALLPLP